MKVVTNSDDGILDYAKSSYWDHLKPKSFASLLTKLTKIHDRTLTCEGLSVRLPYAFMLNHEYREKKKHIDR